MALRKITAAMAALLMTASPVLAQSNAVPAPQSEAAELGSSLADTNRYLGVVVGAAIIAIILYIVVQAGDDDDDDDPVSP